MLDENRRYNLPTMAGRPATKAAPLFGQRLVALRRHKGWTQTQLAERLATTREMVDYYERRAPNPSLEVIQKLAEALEVSVPELLGVEMKAAHKRRKPGPTPFHIPLSCASTNQWRPSSSSSTRGTCSFHLDGACADHRSGGQ